MEKNTLKKIGVALICASLLAGCAVGSAALLKASEAGAFLFPWESEGGSSSEAGSEIDSKNGGVSAEIQTTGVALRQESNTRDEAGGQVTVYSFGVTPSEASQSVSLTLAWADPSADFDIAQYITASVDNDSRKITIDCSQSFGNQAVLTVSSVKDPTKMATVTLDYLQTFEFAPDGSSFDPLAFNMSNCQKDPETGIVTYQDSIADGLYSPYYLSLAGSAESPTDITKALCMQTDEAAENAVIGGVSYTKERDFEWSFAKESAGQSYITYSYSQVISVVGGRKNWKILSIDGWSDIPMDVSGCVLEGTALTASQLTSSSQAKISQLPAELKSSLSAAQANFDSNPSMFSFAVWAVIPVKVTTTCVNAADINGKASAYFCRSAKLKVGSLAFA